MLMNLTPVTLIVSLQGILSMFDVTNHSAHDSGRNVIAVSGHQ